MTLRKAVVIKTAMLVEDKIVILGLSMLRGIGSKRLREIVASLDSPSDILSLSESELINLPHIKRLNLLPYLSDGTIWDVANNELEKAQKRGIKIITYLEYSDTINLFNKDRLNELPPVLFVSGNRQVLKEIKIGLIGTRVPSNYGLYMTKRLVSECIESGLVTISGGALGIDSAVAKNTIDKGGKHICVLGSNIINPYPLTNKRLFERITEKGLLLSQFASNNDVTKSNFPLRNRTLALLSEALVMIEAPAKSGALLTVDYASNYGVPVYTPPSDVGRKTAEGNLKLLKNKRAKILTSISDIEFLRHKKKTNTRSKEKKGPFPTLTEEERSILEALKGVFGDVDNLLNTVEIPSHKVLSILTALEIKGIIEKDGPNHFDVIV